MATTAAAAKDKPQQQPAPAQAKSEVQPGSAAAAPKPTHPLVAFKTYLDGRMSELQFALPPHISPERFTRVALTALQRKPELLKCTKQSLWNACLLAAQDGLLPDGREGAIAPYGESDGGKRVAEIATWMPMVEGLRKKARNSGEIADWMVRIVRAQDTFHVSLGDDEKIVHEPYIGPDDPGSIVAAYSIARLKDGAISREVMTLRDIEKIKAKSKAKNGPWGDATFFPEMCKKTVARRHYKQLPHSSDLDDMIARDDEAFGLDDRSDEQIADRQARRLTSTGAAFDEFARGPVIEHEAEAGDGELAPAATELDGEFADDAPQPEQAQQPEQQQQQPEGKQTPAGKPAGEPEATPPKQEPEKQPDKPSEPAQQAAWPKDQVPKSPEEYERYAKAHIASLTTANAVGSWFKSEDQRKLRNACSVTKDTFDAVKAVAQNRITELKG